MIPRTFTLSLPVSAGSCRLLALSGLRNPLQSSISAEAPELASPSHHESVSGITPPRPLDSSGLTPIAQDGGRSGHQYPEGHEYWYVLVHGRTTPEGEGLCGDERLTGLLQRKPRRNVCPDPRPIVVCEISMASGGFSGSIRLTLVVLAGKHVRSCIVYTWDHKSSAAFWAGMKVYVLFGNVGMAKT